MNEMNKDYRDRQRKPVPGEISWAESGLVCFFSSSMEKLQCCWIIWSPLELFNKQLQTGALTGAFREGLCNTKPYFHPLQGDNKAVNQTTLG